MHILLAPPSIPATRTCESCHHEPARYYVQPDADSDGPLFRFLACARCLPPDAPAPIELPPIVDPVQLVTLRPRTRARRLRLVRGSL